MLGLVPHRHDLGKHRADPRSSSVKSVPRAPTIVQKQPARARPDDSAPRFAGRSRRAGSPPAARLAAKACRKARERVGAAARHAPRQARRPRRNRGSPPASFAVASAGQLAAAFRKAAPCSIDFAMAFARSGKRFGELGEFGEVAARPGTPPAFGKQDRIVPARAEARARRRAIPASSPRRRPAPSCDGRFQPMAVAEAADRKGRGQPVQRSGAGTASPVPVAQSCVVSGS